MKKIAIYGGTELSAPESWFVVSLTHALLLRGEIVIVTGGFLYWPDRVPGTISTDFSVMQGALNYSLEKKVPLAECLETWLPDPKAETDPHKKGVVRFEKGKVEHLVGESAEARRYSMVRKVDALITIKGSNHTKGVLEFAKSINKPALPLDFTGGKSSEFWAANKERIVNWFGLTKELSARLERQNMENWLPEEKESLIKEVTAAVVDRAIPLEEANQIKYGGQLQKMDGVDVINKDFAQTSEERKIIEMQGTKSQKRLSLFFSYSHKDDAWRDELDKHLTALKRSGKISVWFDKEIEGGSDWDKTIKKELYRADVILLLISPDFVESDYINDVELSYAMEKERNGEVKVIPIYLRRAFTDGMPFERLQGYISLDKPIAPLAEFERDNAFYEVVKGINNDLNKLLARQ